MLHCEATGKSFPCLDLGLPTCERDRLKPSLNKWYVPDTTPCLAPLDLGSTALLCPADHSGSAPTTSVYVCFYLFLSAFPANCWVEVAWQVGPTEGRGNPGLTENTTNKAS